jgi:hypothetical protein
LPSIFETGNLLETSKSEMAYGEWARMFRECPMPFDKKSGERLIKISDDKRLRDGAHALHLPVSWMTLYELTKLTDEQFENGINSGSINPGMKTVYVRGEHDTNASDLAHGRG